MRLRFRRLGRDDRGVAALEFALIVPGLVLMIVGIAQLGSLFMANAGLSQAVAAGARYATIWPRPSDTQIRNCVTGAAYGLNVATLTVPTPAHGTDNGASYVDITASYTVATDFIFFTGPTVTLSETRRAFQQPTSATVTAPNC